MAADWLVRLQKPKPRPYCPSRVPLSSLGLSPLESEDIINCDGPLNDPIPQQTFNDAGWFAVFLHDLWKTSVHLGIAIDTAHSPTLP